MYKKMGKSKLVEKEEQTMSVIANLERPCTISESIMQSCKEVKNMREGKTTKRSLNDLFANIEKWNQFRKIPFDNSLF
ncbi:MAG: hypothetical protein HDR20_03095 [Lachnospiraceae bacterium]|nr:hypothetical protein [Lachnospiraceae bacterium]